MRSRVQSEDGEADEEESYVGSSRLLSPLSCGNRSPIPLPNQMTSVPLHDRQTRKLQSTLLLRVPESVPRHRKRPAADDFRYGKCGASARAGRLPEPPPRPHHHLAQTHTEAREASQPAAVCQQSPLCSFSLLGQDHPPPSLAIGGRRTPAETEELQNLGCKIIGSLQISWRVSSRRGVHRTEYRL